MSVKILRNNMNERLPCCLLFKFKEPCNGNGADGKPLTSGKREVPTCDVADD
jgi:hypothetical protein